MGVTILIVVILLVVFGLLFYWLWKKKKHQEGEKEMVNYGFNIRSNSGNLEPLNLSNKVRFKGK